MGSNSCRSWEEDIYWIHFQFLHFAQLLPSTFHQHLALPKTFSDNVKKKLPENVTLKGPSGGVVWNIGLTRRDDTLYFTHGWAQFVKDHSLKENDFLVFKYNGESLFEVLIFDGESFCEKPASYFVRKHQHGNAEQNEPENSVEDVNTPNGSSECVSDEKSMNLNTTQVTLDDQLPSKTPNGKSSNIGVESGCPEKEKLMDDAVTSTKLAAVNLVQKKQRGRPPRAYKSLNSVTESKGKSC